MVNFPRRFVLKEVFYAEVFTTSYINSHNSLLCCPKLQEAFPFSSTLCSSDKENSVNTLLASPIRLLGSLSFVAGFVEDYYGQYKKGTNKQIKRDDFKLIKMTSEEEI